MTVRAEAADSHPNGSTLAALFDHAFARWASRVAVTSEHGSWTYHEVGGRSRRLAAGLRAQGIRRGVRVAVLSPPRVEYVECYAAMARLGVTVLTLNTRMHVDELEYCLRAGNPAMVIADDQFGGQISELRGRLPDIAQWVSLDGTIDGALVYSSLLDNDGVLAEPMPAADDIHNVLYTSGTTGRPKGAMVSQSAAAVRALRLAQWFSLGPKDGFIGWLPMFHCAGDESLYATFLTGGRYATFTTVDVEAMYARIERERLSWTLLLPGVITDFLDNPRRRDFDLSSLRLAIGYANMMPHVVQRLTAECGLDFYDAFGQTETSYLVAHGISSQGAEPSLRKWPGPLCEISLVRSDLTEVPVGEPGECLVRGPAVMSGYLDDPAATAAAMSGGWLHTGDVLVQNDDGSYSFVDRTKYLIKSGGENIYPAEIEAAIAAHPGVQEACAFGVPHPRWGEAVKAVVVRAEGSRVEADELIQWCRDRLAGYKRPRFLTFMLAEELPRSTTGKLQRHVLAADPVTEDQEI